MSVPRGTSTAAILDRPERVCCNACQLIGAEPHPPAAAQRLRAEHDRIHHRGHPVAHTTTEEHR